jgi:hypothetical protein
LQWLRSRLPQPPTLPPERRRLAARSRRLDLTLSRSFDFRSIDAAFEENFPGKAKEIAATWRARLFEYTWLRTLNRNYANLEQVSQDALTFACKSARTELSPEVPGKILDAFLQLKPFPDPVGALKAMRGRESGSPMFPTSRPGC